MRTSEAKRLLKTIPEKLTEYRPVNKRQIIAPIVEKTTDIEHIQHQHILRLNTKKPPNPRVIAETAEVRKFTPAQTRLQQNIAVIPQPKPSKLRRDQRIDLSQPNQLLGSNRPILDHLNQQHLDQKIVRASPTIRRTR